MPDPVEGVSSCGGRATAPVEDIWCEQIRGCSYRGRDTFCLAVQRQRDGFPLDQSRVAYLRYLRRERRQSPRSEADADHVKVKTEMLQLRPMEKKHELVPRTEVDALIEALPVSR